ncbi:MAG: hypothetical protein IPL08_03830 [Saprospiraceae bacterium]|nr:hypothetical protein [Saprospiraceae bacterium]MBK8669317.1 hypothetical protein [Saprospiraceae bacterium]
MDELKWSYNEFLAFLLIYISHVDMEFVDEEKAMIKKNVGEPTYSKMLEQFDAMSDFKAYQTILDYKGVYYPTHDRKNEVIEKMKDLFYADADFNIMERELLHFLDRMM